MVGDRMVKKAVCVKRGYPRDGGDHSWESQTS